MIRVVSEIQKSKPAKVFLLFSLFSGLFILFLLNILKNDGLGSVLPASESSYIVGPRPPDEQWIDQHWNQHNNNISKWSWQWQDSIIPSNCTFTTESSTFDVFEDINKPFWHTLSPDARQGYKKELYSFIDSLANVDFKSIEDTIDINSRGIVYCVHRFIVRQAIQSLQILRQKGCTLPVEIYHYKELHRNYTNRLLAIPNVRIIDLSRIYNDNDALFTRVGDGRLYQVKVAALLATRFDHVLLLDGDNVPLVNPDFLFSSEPLRQTGTLFWKDFWKTHPRNPVWDILGLDCVDEQEQESGQVNLWCVFATINV